MSRSNPTQVPSLCSPNPATLAALLLTRLPSATGPLHILFAFTEYSSTFSTKWVIRRLHSRHISWSKPSLTPDCIKSLRKGSSSPVYLSFVATITAANLHLPDYLMKKNKFTTGPQAPWRQGPCCLTSNTVPAIKVAMNIIKLISNIYPAISTCQTLPYSSKN